MHIHNLGTPVFIVSGARSYSHDDGSIVVMGELINRGHGAATGVTIIATAVDEVCDLLAVEEKSIGYLRSTQCRPFKIILHPQGGEPLNLHLYLAHDPMDSSLLPNDGFEVAPSGGQAVHEEFE